MIRYVLKRGELFLNYLKGFLYNEFAQKDFMNQVPHLILDCTINGHNIKAVIDSGVGSSIMSLTGAKCAEVHTLVDTSKAGTCFGAGGKSKIIGKIHLLILEIDNVLLPCSFYIGEMSIFKSLGVDILIGLDFLAQHNVSVDMDKLTLDVRSTNQSVAIWRDKRKEMTNDFKFNDNYLLTKNENIPNKANKKMQYRSLIPKIGRHIKNKDIAGNKMLAPAYFSSSDRPHLLFARCWINGKELSALIDTGAYTTFISKSAASRCDVLSNVDKSYAGKKLGIGIINLIGRVHSVRLCFGRGIKLPVSLNVLEELDIDMLLGLNIFASYNITIDMNVPKLFFRKYGKEIPLIQAIIPR